MRENLDWHAARAALEWQIELGATDCIGDAPSDSFALPAEAPWKTRARPAPPRRAEKPAPTEAPPAAVATDPTVDPVAVARATAAAATDLDTLHATMAAFEHCELKKGARNLVFCDGQPAARVMIVGEAPGRDEDRQGKPFVGRAGQLLDRMFAAIDMGRDAPDPARALYITNMLPWRPPQNRDPSAQELAMMRPFIERHIALADPQVLVLMGRISTGALLETREGITRLRGQWRTLMDRPCLPMLHPAYLLRTPAAKRHAWSDLLSLQARMRELP